MILKRDWLWDRKISVRQAKSILQDPGNRHFFILSALLLSRKNTPSEVLRYYLKPAVFLKYWERIKRQMRKDSWNNPRIEFWQAIYETLKEKYEKKGIVFSKEIVVKKAPNAFCREIAEKIKVARKTKGLTQAQLAKKLKVSQQIISRIESGSENVSLQTLKKITDALSAQLQIDIVAT